MTLSRNVLAGLSVAALLLPAAASAHSDGLKVGTMLTTNTSMALRLQVGSREHASSTEAHHATSTALVARNTGTRLSAEAQRTLSIADFMGSLSSTLSSRIASSSLSATSTAHAQAKLSAFNADVLGAKTKAQAALALATQISSSTSASSTLVSQAKADLKSAQEYLRAAQKDFKAVLRVIFHA
jgi:hypothetical protein